MSPLGYAPHYYAFLCYFWVDGNLTEPIWYRNPLNNKLLVYTDRGTALKVADELSTNSTLIVVNEYWPEEIHNYNIMDD